MWGHWTAHSACLKRKGRAGQVSQSQLRRQRSSTGTDGLWAAPAQRHSRSTAAKGLETTCDTIPWSHTVPGVKPLTFRWATFRGIVTWPATSTYPIICILLNSTSFILYTHFSTLLITLSPRFKTSSVYKYISRTLALRLKSDHWGKLIPICLNWQSNLSLANWTQPAIWDLLPFFLFLADSGLCGAQRRRKVIHTAAWTLYQKV